MEDLFFWIAENSINLKFNSTFHDGERWLV